MPDALDLLKTRRSVKPVELSGPGPTAAELDTILTVASRVPDHGKLTPWRFVLVEGDARVRLGEILADRHGEIVAEASEASLEKERNRFLSAPTIVVAVGRIDPDHRIPAQEQLLSGGCACFSLLLAAHALGFGAQWLTGWAAYDPQVAARLGLAEGECILGFIHIGTTEATPPDRPRPDPAAVLERWHG